MKATQNQIERLQAQLVAETALHDLCTSDPLLKELVETYSPLFHSSSNLYGSKGCLGFKASKGLLKALPALFDKAVNTQQASGNWYYCGFPANEVARTIISNKDSKVRWSHENNCQFQYSVNGFKVSFYYQIDQDSLIEIAVDYSNVIIGQRYNQFGRAIKIPYLMNNPRYDENKRNQYEKQYIGVNCLYETNNYSIHDVNSFKDLLVINSQFEASDNE